MISWLGSVMLGFGFEGLGLVQGRVRVTCVETQDHEKLEFQVFWIRFLMSGHQGNLCPIRDEKVQDLQDLLWWCVDGRSSKCVAKR